MNENKESDLVIECLHYMTEKLIKRYHEYTAGLCVSILNFSYKIMSMCNLLFFLYPNLV